METTHKINTICLFIITIVALAFVFAQAKVVLIPFTLAIFISLIYSPFISFLESKIKLPRPLILTSSFLLLIFIFSIIVLFVGMSIDSFIQDADQYKEKFKDFIEKLLLLFENIGYDIQKENIEKLLKSIPIGKFVKAISGSMLSLLSNTFLVIIFTLFILSGDRSHKKENSIIEEIKKNAGSYIQTKLVTSTLTATLTYVVLISFGVEMSFMFAILTFLLNFIPNIGSMIAVIIPLPIILLQYEIGFIFLSILVILVTIQTLIGNVLEPKLLGDTMGLHPVTILLFLTFWGFLWGVTGMFLSVPITATLKIIFDKFDFTKPIAKLFSGELD